MPTVAPRPQASRDDRAAGGFVAGIVVYAVVMICLFAWPDGSDLVPDLLIRR